MWGDVGGMCSQYTIFFAIFRTNPLYWSFNLCLTSQIGGFTMSLGQARICFGIVDAILWEDHGEVLLYFHMNHHK